MLSKKNNGIETFLEALLDLKSGERTERIEKNICVICSNEALEFEDALSRKEFSISGMCQKCQNEVFKES